MAAIAAAEGIAALTGILLLVRSSWFWGPDRTGDSGQTWVCTDKETGTRGLIIVLGFLFLEWIP